mgnify:CR=1 FL=1
MKNRENTQYPMMNVQCPIFNKEKMIEEILGDCIQNIEFYNLNLILIIGNSILDIGVRNQ